MPEWKSFFSSEIVPVNELERKPLVMDPRLPFEPETQEDDGFDQFMKSRDLNEFSNKEEKKVEVVQIQEKLEITDEFFADLEKQREIEEEEPHTPEVAVDGLVEEETFFDNQYWKQPMLFDLNELLADF